MRDTNKEKGITLIALVITIIVLLIIASISTYTGINAIKSSKLTKFKQELEIMQAEVDLLYEKCKNDDGNLDADKINSIGKDLSNLDTEEINDIFYSFNIDNTEDYRYYDIETIENLGISGVENEYLVSIKDRNVISIEGFESDGKLYRNLYEFPEKKRVGGSLDKGEVTFSVDVEEDSEGWNIHISNIEYSKYVGKGKILYQQVGEENWTTLVTEFKDDEYSFVIQEPGEYNIKIIDAANVEKITDESITIEALGNYLVDGTTYYDTLQEAVDGANNGSMIKVMKDVTEQNNATINKNVTINLNQKTITFQDNLNIQIEQSYKVIINGKGNIDGGSGSSSLIYNEGDLEINNAKISSLKSGDLIGTIGNRGNLVTNSCEITNDTINSIFTSDIGSNTIINGGNYGRIYDFQGELTVNGGTIEEIYINGHDMFVTIVAGVVNKLGSNLDADTIGTFIIGSADDEINQNNPIINDITWLSQDIIFYNGIIKCKNSIDFENFIKQVRTGYKTQITYDSSTQYYTAALVPE